MFFHGICNICNGYLLVTMAIQNPIQWRFICKPCSNGDLPLERMVRTSGWLSWLWCYLLNGHFGAPFFAGTPSEFLASHENSMVHPFFFLRRNDFTSLKMKSVRYVFIFFTQLGWLWVFLGYLSWLSSHFPWVTWSFQCSRPSVVPVS